MKHFLLCAAVLLGWSMNVMGQYHYVTYENYGKNPGDLNTDKEDVTIGPATGWTAIHEGNAPFSPEWSATQVLPTGFDFEFNGEQQFAFKVSTSGVLTFDIGAPVVPVYANEALPSAHIPDKSVMVWGMFAKGTSEKIYSKMFGTAPNRQLWVHFNQYESEGNSLGFCNFYWSIVLEEGTDNIYLVDQRGSVISTCVGGLTLGVQIDGSNALQVDGSPNLNNLAGNDPTAADNVFYRFSQGEPPVGDMEAVSLDIPGSIEMSQAPLQIKGNFINVGAELKSFDLYYSINGGAPVGPSHFSYYNGSLSGLAHELPWTPSAPGTYSIALWVENPNGVSDATPLNNMVTASIDVIGESNKNLAIVEGFTQHNCGPCAAQNPALKALLAQNPTNTAGIKWVVTWPGANDDPRHWFNSADNTARRSYYGVSGVPTAFLGGDIEGAPSVVTQARINDENAIPGFFDIDITENLNGSNIDVSVDVTPLQTFSGNQLKVRVAIVQDELHYPSATGTNGEKDFYDIMRYTIPNAAGTNLNMTAGTTTTVSGSRAVDAIFNGSTMRVVVFIQDDVTQDVLMATKSHGMYFCNNGTVIKGDVTVAEASCGQQTGSISLNVNGGSAPYTYAWNTGDNQANLSNKAAGVYTVTISDNSGCTFQMPIEIEDKAGPNLFVDAQDVSCNDQADGAVTAFVGGGEAPYSYAWTGGGALESLSNLAAGSYQVTVTDANGCTATDVAIVNNPAAVTGSASVVTFDNGTTNGSIMAEGFGGTHPFTYEWNTTPVQTTAMATGLTAGVYEVTITDYNGCSTTATAEVLSNVSIDDLASAGINELTIAPNPSNGTFALELTTASMEQVMVDVLSLDGKTVYRASLGAGMSFNKSIELGDVAAGVYTLRVSTSQGVGHKRLIIK
ncbi:T9SS type A sorting domain-containing protein [Pontibacter sp. G13]|uniref:T9SS type A sorting domain-containing protein n=1 Tax=Pontibacter sp. G13 TaxID=3074898 RepID=UPI00288A0F0B|nr:T9SS type A sorting domain-containing protein [Pontibacter sp. G13]WNJ21404.1 T9SS type A sorting domain-containing protein [Pontibacter sp. G13]